MTGLQGWEGFSGISGYTGTTYNHDAYERFFEVLNVNPSLMKTLEENGFNFGIWNTEFWNEIEKIPNNVLPLFIGIHKDLDTKISERLKNKKEAVGD